MIAAMEAVRILFAVALIGRIDCQDGFSEQDLLRLQQLSNNDGQVETITSYSTNVIQRDPVRNEHSVSSVSVQYHLSDDIDKDNDYHRANHGRSDRRKVFRIKNPFQRQLEHGERQEENLGPQDGDHGASNQYTAMQYSLPPEEFIQKMRAENQYLQQQYSTQPPNMGYTATPQPQYYSKSAQSNYDTNQQQNHVSQLESKLAQAQSYSSNSGSYQYPSSYDNSPSAPSPVPPYVSTVSNNQYVGTPANTYVSSSSPVFMSSQPSMQQYVSSPLAPIQTGSPDYENRITTTGSSNSYSPSYDPNEQTKRMQIDHYDNSANGIRYPINVQQYQNDYPSSTPATPSSSPYPESLHDSWQNAMNAGANSLSKSLQDVSLTQYRNSIFNDNAHLSQDGRDPSQDVNSETHRIGNNVPAANSMYLNFVQPDYQLYNNFRTRPRDLEQEASQPGVYSNGDYGWKLTDKKPLESDDGYQSGNYHSRYQNYAYRPEPAAVSSMNVYYDSPRPHNYDSISKSATESHEGQEFARAAARAHEQMKQQQLEKLNSPYYGHNYAPSFSSISPVNNPQNVVTTYHGNNDKQKKQYADSSNTNPIIYGNNQPDLITALPYYIVNTKENNMDGKLKQPFDHAKALKNIVPIDVSNVVGSSENGVKSNSDSNSNRYNLPNYSKEQLEQSYKQYYKPVTDAYYKDKNTGYGYNIKTKPDEGSIADDMKQLDHNGGYYNKQNQEAAYNQMLGDSKRYSEIANQQINYLTQNQQNNYPNNIQQVARPQNQLPTDISSILKLNDIPYRLTQGLPSDALRLHNSNFDQGAIPTPIPTKLNQNVGSHQLDVANTIFNKLMQSKQPGVANVRPDLDLQPTGLMSTINGFRVANPFNVDLKLVAEMLKGKPPTIDESHIIPLRDQYNKPLPLKLDLTSLQQLLMKNDNYGNLAALSDGLNALGNPYLDVYNSGRYPYQGVKYSRSQEEEETILPIAESSNTHPIGAVIEQDDMPDAREVVGVSELAVHVDDTIANSLEESRHKNIFGHDHRKDRQRHPNSLLSSRHSYHRKYTKSDVPEPYPLLKPPPQGTRGRVSHSKIEKRGHRRRVNSRPKYGRVLKTEPLFEAESSQVEEVEDKPHTLLRPPPPAPDADTKPEQPADDHRS